MACVWRVFGVCLACVWRVGGVCGWRVGRNATLRTDMDSELHPHHPRPLSLAHTEHQPRTPSLSPSPSSMPPPIPTPHSFVVSLNTNHHPCIHAAHPRPAFPMAPGHALLLPKTQTTDVRDMVGPPQIAPCPPPTILTTTHTIHATHATHATHRPHLPTARARRNVHPALIPTGVLQYHTINLLFIYAPPRRPCSHAAPDFT